MRKQVSILFATLMIAAVGPASAQQASTGVSVGSDFWTGSMRPELFQLHENGGAAACTGSEVFVAVSGSLGFCMDASENAAGAVEWEDARATCFAAGKRLPEPAEYKFACQAGIAGLNNMTDDNEWVTNFSQIYFTYNGTPFVGVAAANMGLNSCFRSNPTWVASSIPSSPTGPFRCVR